MIGLLKIRFPPTFEMANSFVSKNNYITFYEPELFTAEFVEVKDNNDLTQIRKLNTEITESN